MEPILQEHTKNIRSEDRELQNTAYRYLIGITEEPVDWAYEVWDEFVEGLNHKNNRVRSISAQMLINLAKSDPENRIRKDFNALLAVTKDERFVTARHCLQNLWNIGLVGAEQRNLLLKGLEARYRECVSEKNSTLIRYDIIQGFRNLYDHEEAKDEAIRAKALALIEAEDDLKYRKKYAALWRNV